MIIKTKAFSRVGLIGNPSDGYFGKTISVICRNYWAQVTCYESPRLIIHPQRSDRSDFNDLDDLVADVRLNGYYGGIRLIKAAIKRFHDYCQEHGYTLRDRNFTIEYDTNIPVRVGLAGSSAIVTATTHALMSFYGVEIAKPFLPNLALSVELEELGIGAGLQDRVIQVYEGVVFMDFGRDYMEKFGHGRYEPIEPRKLPALFVAYLPVLAEGTEVPHNDLRSRFNRGEKPVLDAITRFAELAQESKDLIAAGKGNQIGPLMDENFDLRLKVMKVHQGNVKMVDIARRHGASAKLAGSGGAIVGTYDGDPERFQQLKQAYGEVGAEVFQPTITD